MKICKGKLAWGILLVVLGVVMITMSGCGAQQEDTDSGVTVVATTPSAPSEQPQEEEKPEPNKRYRITSIGGSQWVTTDIQSHTASYIKFVVDDREVTVHGNFFVEEQ